MKKGSETVYVKGKPALVYCALCKELIMGEMRQLRGKWIHAEKIKCKGQ